MELKQTPIKSPPRSANNANIHPKQNTYLNKLNWQIDYSLPISKAGILIVFAPNGVLGWCQCQFNGIKNLFEWFKSPPLPKSCVI